MDRVTQQVYLLADGETKVDGVTGYAAVAYEYDENSRVTSETYYGADGWGTENADGVARIERSYDADGNVVEEKRFNLNRIQIP